MKKLVLDLYVATVAVVSMLLVSGCSGSGDSSLLATVPADVVAVVNTNADRLLKEAGCQLDGNKVVLSKDLDKVLSAEEYGETLKEVLASGAIDLNSMVTFVTKDELPVNTLRLNDPDLFKEYISKLSGEWREDGDYSIVNYKGADIVVRDTQCWILESEKSLSILKDIELAAGQKSIVALAGIENALTADGDVRAVISTADLGIADLYGDAAYQGAWAAVNVALKGSIAEADMSLISSKGERLDFASMLDDIDADVLDLLDNDDSNLLAVGVSDDTDWPALVAKIASQMSRGDAMMLSMITPYLEKIAGTVAVAVAPVGSARSLMSSIEGWKITFVAHLERGEAANMVEQIKNFITQARIPMSEEDDMTIVSLPGGDVRFGERAGYLVVTTRDVYGSGADQFASAVKGKKAVACVDVPYNSELMKAQSLKYGYSATLSAEKNELSLRVSLNGANVGIIEALIAEVANDIKE